MLSDLLIGPSPTCQHGNRKLHRRQLPRNLSPVFRIMKRHPATVCHFQKLGIFDTKLGLIIVYSAMGIPMSFFVMVSYYKTISTALEESAYIDGATFIQTFLHIILPLAKPGLVTIAMIQFINIWNEFYFALMLTSGDRARTVPIALNYYMGTFANNYSALFAAVVMTVLPTIVLFILLQRQVMESLTAGAVKG